MLTQSGEVQHDVSTHTHSGLVHLTSMAKMKFTVEPPIFDEKVNKIWAMMRLPSAACDAHVGLCLKQSYTVTELCRNVHLLITPNLMFQTQEVKLGTRGRKIEPR